MHAAVVQYSTKSQGEFPDGRHVSATNMPARLCQRISQSAPPPTHLVGTRSQVGLEFPIDLLHGPSALVCTDHLSRDPLVQIGHEDFVLFRARVSPSFAQNHRDVTDVPQTQACAIDPEGFTPLSPGGGAPARAGNICAANASPSL